LEEQVKLASPESGLRATLTAKLQEPEPPVSPGPVSSRPLLFRLKLAFARISVILALIFTARYFFWRIAFTLNPVAKWFFYIFLTAEMLNFLESLLFYITTWTPTRYATPEPLNDCTVDVFIATYNESLELLRETAACAVSIRYPHKTCILDDGNRPEVAQLAQELGCEYFTRQEHKHAKAGNLNNAMKFTSGDFILVLDADHVPSPDIIDQLLGFFRDPKVGIVQAAQDFYNLDSFQHLTSWNTKYGWQQQELFFNIIQPGKDHFNAAFYCGSPAILRREALNDVGGFAIDTITEDMHTGLRMQKKGWHVLYHNRTLARGLAPQTYAGFATQWQRWGHGAMQVFRVENPIFCKQLSFGQRLCYFSSFYFYWMGYQKVIYMLTPAFCLLTGLFPLSTQPETFVSYFGPFFLLNLVACCLLQGGFRNFLMSEEFNVLKLKVLMMSAKGLVSGEGKFQVTPKSQSAGADWRDMKLHGLLALIVLSAIAFGLKRLFTLQGFVFWAYAVNLFWAAFYFCLITPLIWRAMRRKEMRSTYRFPARLGVPLTFKQENAEPREGYARNMNRSGLSITLSEELPLDSLLEIEIKLPKFTVIATGRVMRHQKFKNKKDGRLLVSNGIKFEHIEPSDQDEISKYLFWEVAPREGRVLRLTRMSQEMEGVQ
jgi:cellulose synthase (UDP-forming)